MGTIDVLRKPDGFEFGFGKVFDVRGFCFTLVHSQMQRSYLRIVLLFFLFLTASCGVGYVVSSSFYQMELLALREPVLQAKLKGTLNRKQLRALSTIEDARHYAASLGFEVSDIYTSVALEWNREMWNVSACESLRFEPKTWWFPIVGNVPYLGFFSEEKASQFYGRQFDKANWKIMRFHC